MAKTSGFSFRPTSGIALSVLFLLVLSPPSTGQSLTPINRANCELAMRNTIDASAGAIPDPPDFNGNGLDDLGEIGCFCDAYVFGSLSPAAAAAFDANVAIVDSIDGNVELFVPGFDIAAGYWSTTICDGQGIRRMRSLTPLTLLLMPFSPRGWMAIRIPAI